MPFDRAMIEAELSLDLIGSSDMPKIAWDALEAGLDGPGIRRLAALVSPTYFEIRDVLPRAMQEMGLVTLTRATATVRLAKRRAQEILDGADDPLTHVRDFRQLWIDSGFLAELRPVGNMYDDFFLTSENRSYDTIRAAITERLRDLVRSGGNSKR